MRFLWNSWQWTFCCTSYSTVCDHFKIPWGGSPDKERRKRWWPRACSHNHPSSPWGSGRSWKGTWDTNGGSCSTGWPGRRTSEKLKRYHLRGETSRIPVKWKKNRIQWKLNLLNNTYFKLGQIQEIQRFTFYNILMYLTIMFIAFFIWL